MRYNLRGQPIRDGELCRIADMVVGEVGYTVPWAVDRKDCQLSLDYSVFSEPGGTATLRVERKSTCYEVGEPSGGKQ